MGPTSHGDITSVLELEASFGISPLSVFSWQVNAIDTIPLERGPLCPLHTMPNISGMMIADLDVDASPIFQLLPVLAVPCCAEDPRGTQHGSGSAQQYITVGSSRSLSDSALPTASKCETDRK